MKLMHCGSRPKVIIIALFVFVVWWRLLADAPSLHSLSIEKSARFTDSVGSSSTESSNGLRQSTKTKSEVKKIKSTTTTSCAPREGLIIVNVLGLLANNLFEVAFANRLSEQLCWPVVYRPFWNAELPSKRGYECFTQADLPQNHKQLPPTISTRLQQDIQLDASTWERWAVKPGENAETQNKEYRKWAERMAYHNHSVAQLAHLEFDFTGDGVDKLVEDIRSPTSHIQVVSTEAFFIHYDWMKEWMPRIREWLSISPSCCKHDPPDNAVVMHVRDFDIVDGGYNGLKPSVYVEILYNYHYMNRPLWIVCQPKSAGSPFVQEIVDSMKGKVTIVTGIDQYDAFCTLTRAKTLILSYVSSYSQMAALLNKHGDEVEVHYPLATLDKPEVTLAVPGWKYHLVKESLDGIKQWNMEYDKIHTKMA